MEFFSDIWIEYLIRFAHLVAGIAWIGSSFYFIWLDSSFEPPTVPRRNVEGELYMVHGGFYYQVEKRKIYPGELPKVLHWFKWEATLTWITGFLLLIVVYYLKGANLLVDPVKNPISQLQAIGLSLGIIVISWLIYDFIWNKNIFKNFWISVSFSAVFVFGLIYTNYQLFSGRGAFIQTGVVFGTLMLLNVWIRILPGQRKMISDAQTGKVPDYTLSLKSKTRSVHNTYFTFPVLFIMLSNHYPVIYNHTYAWLMLILLSVSGALVRHAMVCKKPIERWTLLPAGLGLLALVYMTSATTTQASQRSLNDHKVLYSDIAPIIQKRCITCHAQNPTDDVFKVTPKGLALESEQQVNMAADIIRTQVIISRVMPLGNKTLMTDEERETLRIYLDQLRQ